MERVHSNAAQVVVAIDSDELFFPGTRRLERHFNVTMRVTPLSRSRIAGHPGQFFYHTSSPLNSSHLFS
jgi:hypothetical protein